jgi:hypothetical protein
MPHPTPLRGYRTGTVGQFPFRAAQFTDLLTPPEGVRVVVADEGHYTALLDRPHGAAMELRLGDWVVAKDADTVFVVTDATFQSYGATPEDA